MIKKAMILAAGFGKRVNPLTLNCPKPLLRIGDETLLSNTIKFLQNFGIKKIAINVHYLGEQIIDYINKEKFNSSINILREEKNILDTGGGILNAIDYFSDEPFLVINPDTIWSPEYTKELKLMEDNFFSNKVNKCSMLVVDKLRSFDKNLKGDFNLENNLIKKNNTELKYIYTGVQIIKPEVFSDIKQKIFSIETIWKNLIKKKEITGLESNIDFLHVTSFNTYQNLLKNLNIK